jgi:hypothetical protein
MYTIIFLIFETKHNKMISLFITEMQKTRMQKTKKACIEEENWNFLYILDD